MLLQAFISSLFVTSYNLNHYIVQILECLFAVYVSVYIQANLNTSQVPLAF